MTDSGGKTETGSLVLGLVQSLGVYGLGVVVLVAAGTASARAGSHRGVLLEIIGVLSVALSIAVAVGQNRAGHGRTAGGVVLGTILWPAIAFALLVWAFIHALSHAPIPF